MSLNHHILAKTATDIILDMFKSTKWKCVNGSGEDFYRVSVSSGFPSPDAAFYDPSQKIIVSFEFKPPTETKRGILTGIGQSIGYLQNTDLAYLEKIIPRLNGSLSDKQSVLSQRISTDFTIQWKKITEICSLPDLT